MVEHWVNHIDRYHECIIVEDGEKNRELSEVENELQCSIDDTVKTSYSELSFLKQGRPRTYLLRLSVCLSVCPVWNQKNQNILVENLTMMQRGVRFADHVRGPRSGPLPEKLSSAPRSTSSINWTKLFPYIRFYGW